MRIVEIIESISPTSYATGMFDRVHLHGSAIECRKTTEKLSSLVDAYESTLNLVNLPEKYTDLSKLMKNIISSINSEESLKLDKILSGNDKKGNEMRKFISLLDKKCSGIMKVYRNNGGSFLYRGMKNVMSKSGNDTADILHGMSPVNRVPKDSSEMASDIFNSVLSDAGIKARRDNSIFVIPSSTTASNYGEVYIIFPVDGYDCTWTKIRDWVISDSSIRLFVDPELLLNKFRAMKTLITLDEDKITCNNLISNLTHLMGNPESYQYSNAIQNCFVFINHINNTYKLSYSTHMRDYMTPEALIKHTGLRIGDISTAISRDVEIYISGEYYALNIRNRSLFETMLFEKK